MVGVISEVRDRVKNKITGDIITIQLYSKCIHTIEKAGVVISKLYGLHFLRDQNIPGIKS